MVKDVNGEILRDGIENQVRRSWSEYFEQVLNVEYVMETKINSWRCKRMEVLGELNERGISIGNVKEACSE